MFNISIYLEKFQTIKDPKIFRREMVDVLNQVTGHSLTEKEVDYKKGVVTVSGHSMLRSEIYQKRAELIEKLAASYPVSDIR